MEIIKDCYISKLEVVRILQKAYAEGRISAIDDCASVLDDINVADVQPVKRGKWCPPLMGQGKFATYCSFCQYTVMRNAAGIFEETPFCPYCGAKMSNE